MREASQQLTPQQVASFCGVSSQTVDDWLTNGRLHALSKDGQRVVDAEDLMQFMDDNHLAIPVGLSHPDPAVAATAPPREAPLNKPPLIRPEGPCALLVARDDYILLTAEHILKDLGIATLRLEQKDVSEDVCRQLQPNLLMLEVGRADQPSLALIEAFCAQTEGDSKVLAISDQMPSVLVRAKAAGANAILTKPFDNDTFKRTVRILLKLN